MLMTQKHPELNWYFITMTNRDHIHKEGDTEKSLVILRHAWSLYRKRMNRHVGLVYWVKVFEMHKTGIYHLHVIVGADKPLTYDWLHEHIFQSGMGYMFDRKKLTEQSIRYVAKYSTKTNIAIRAIEWSRNFPKLDESIPEQIEEWEYLGNIDIITALQWDDATGREWKLLTDYEEKDD
jgi:hypothetical protein